MKRLCVGLLLLPLPGLVYAQESEILKIYGGFENDGRSMGWEQTDTRGNVKYTVVKGGVDGQYCLEISQTAGKYTNPGIRIDPDFVWETDKALTAVFSVCLLQRWNGYYLSFYVIGEVDQKTVVPKKYRWYYIFYHQGEKENVFMQRRAKVWNCREPLSGFDGLRPDTFTYTEWLGGLQPAVDSWELTRWKVFEVNVKDSLSATDVPFLPDKVRITEIGFCSYAYDTCDWMVDNIRLIGK